MDFRGDDRGVTVQIGAVLLLGFLVVSLSMYQATVVPQENEEVEFRHNQRAVSDMQEVRNGILRTAATGSSAPTAVELGTQYPARTVFVNPAPPGGTLSTSPLGNVTIRNAKADDPRTRDADFPETDDFWNGDAHAYATKALSYSPSYARYRNAPTTVYENGVLYNRFGENDTIAVTDQSLVAGRRISLVTLSGDLSRGGTGTLSVSPRAVSQSTRTVTVARDDSRAGNVSILLSTRLDADAWRSLLEESGQYDGTGDESNERYVHAVNDAGPDAVELVFERNATYQLRLSNVAVGANAGDTEPAYLTSVDGIEFPYEGQKESFVVEVRDRYNNPVGSQVEAAAARGTVPNGTVEEAGRYRYVYEAPDASGSDTVNVTVPALSDSAFDPSDPEDLRYDVAVQTVNGGDDGSDDGPSETSAIDLTVGPVNDNSDSAKLTVSAQATAQDADGDDDLERMTFELVDGDGQVLRSKSYNLNGDSVTRNVNFNNVERGTNPHTFRVTAVDADGNVQEDERTVG
ncbi:hypothetical protein [Halogeometricum luteum]|uniref:Cadherin domain-containing protein n=1 Tax=Halogeometricum luteum TaxID=2950537 RepID=A0ABU2G2Y0_9EURY|nr:hypothetical protein [Halogeometricum sp. S3BR5-2]MDS0294533.1 hypothetical protein [Halogeometricum sp. S3BR5-2]